MPKYYYHSWTKDEETTLSNIMSNGGRKKISELFIEASKKLERSVSACENRWYEIREEQKAV